MRLSAPSLHGLEESLINISTQNSDALNELEKQLGIKFECIDLLAQAMRHPSVLNEEGWSSLESYERLEFLGDSFLGWVVAQEVYKRFPNFHEGELTKIRALLVRGSNLQYLSKALNLGNYMELGQGEKTSGGRSRSSNLAAVFESLIGAILLDRGQQVASDLILRLFAEQIDSITSNEFLNDSKSELQEFLQKKGMPLPIYQLASAKGPSHSKLFTVQVIVNSLPIAEGKAQKKTSAEQQAAKFALAILRNQSSEQG